MFVYKINDSKPAPHATPPPRAAATGTITPLAPPPQPPPKPARSRRSENIAFLHRKANKLSEYVEILVSKESDVGSEYVKASYQFWYVSTPN